MYEFELQNQAGSSLQIGEDDRRALVTGLALHEKARKTLAQVSGIGPVPNLTSHAP